jgi:hypothetical protein
MTNRDPNTRIGRIAVFKLNTGRVITGLATSSLFAYTEKLPDFSHWGTEEFIIDMTPPKEAA